MMRCVSADDLCQRQQSYCRKQGVEVIARVKPVAVVLLAGI